MNKKYAVIVALLSIGVLILVGCNLLPPQCALQLYEAPTISSVGNDVEISFRLYNIGSENLQNCKVKWYADTSDLGPAGTIESSEITDWVPSIGIDLSILEISGLITVTTTSGIYTSGLAGIDSYGVYAWGWENPPDE